MRHPTIFLFIIAVLSLVACRRDVEIEVPASNGRVLVVSNPNDPRATWELSPLADAVVRIEWWAKVDALVDNGWACVRSEEAVSSSNGEFIVPAWMNRRRSVYDIEWRAYVMEPGYETRESDLDPQNGLPGHRHTLVVRRAADGAVPIDPASFRGPEYGCWDQVK